MRNACLKPKPLTGITDSGLRNFSLDVIVLLLAAGAASIPIIYLLGLLLDFK